ncbi:flagellar export chaperone FliS [Desulforhabdus sp. TSK]|uniref:flagellar export chaperone FliS n=1 Tax=Desulforhabdus sp. TSK TaxID=2925014 RepID=UPI001FC8DFC3|nr:flagellar export chaperone FliS [Desulforhabdus sp. TSK]GKT07329.1 hypothetical protein DSTSK_06340 [Desulforhabdus sp. TSK]
MTPYAHHAYQKTAVNAIFEKERLVVMVFEGIVDFLRQARLGMEERDVARKGEAISSAIALITELDCALDRQTGGELVDNLGRLYDWMMKHLTKANLHSDLKALSEVEAVVFELKEGFEGAAKSIGSPVVAQRTVPSEIMPGVPGPATPTRRLSYAV